MIGTPKRVLHVVGRMNRGGIETWLMHVLRSLDPGRLRIDFLVQTDEAADYDLEIAAYGARLLRCGVSWRSPAYGPAVTSLLHRFGPFDAVHSHVHHFSGFLLRIAHRVGVPLRIAHSHSDTSRQDVAASWPRRRYLGLAKAWIRRHATHWLAASQAAGSALFGAPWGADRRSQVLHCGINLQSFRRRQTRELARERLRIAGDELVIGHVGRFDAPKNHPFLIEIAAEAARRMPRVRLLLVGDGPGRPEIERQADALGLGLRTIFLGSRADVPDLLPAMDVFVFPSLWEGLPLTVVEAQAAGLPCLISDVISPETIVVPDLVQRIQTAAGPSAWAEKLIAAVHEGGDQVAALDRLEKTDFNIERCLETLYALYGV